MNRIIKFRVWEKKNLVMRFWDYLKGISYTHQFALLEDSDFIWMQFTRLKDKNGKEIYEGDILKNENHDEIMATPEDKIIVEWSELGFYKNFNLYNGSEIIGNIYENPELIKK